MGIAFIKEADIQGRTGGYYISPPCPSALLDNVDGQGGQSVRFLENNANYNASLYVEVGIFSFESSELLVL